MCFKTVLILSTSLKCVIQYQVPFSAGTVFVPFVANAHFVKCCLWVKSTDFSFHFQVQAPVVYGVVGTPLTIVCTVNETVIVAGQVSWKHNGKWLHNQTVRELGRVILKFKSVKHLDSGIYQCGVYDSTGQGNAHKKPIPKAKNVSLLVGGTVYCAFNFFALEPIERKLLRALP